MSDARTPSGDAPPYGALVVYMHDSHPDGRTRLRIAEVNGPLLEDPGTGDTWVGVLLPTTPPRYDFVDCTTVAKVGRSE
jgi:hypothetical protein